MLQCKGHKNTPADAPHVPGAGPQKVGTVDTESLARSPRIVTTPDAKREEAYEQLLEASQAALRWFDLYDEHAPIDWVFGGGAKVRCQLRQAIRRVES